MNVLDITQKLNKVINFIIIDQILVNTTTYYHE